MNASLKTSRFPERRDGGRFLFPTLRRGLGRGPLAPNARAAPVRHRSWLVSLIQRLPMIAVLCLTCFASQEIVAGEQAEEGAVRQTIVLQLKSVFAGDASVTLKAIFPDDSIVIVPEEHSNSLIVSASPEEVSTIKEVLSKIEDAAAKPRKDRSRVMRVFPLKHTILNDGNLGELLMSSFGNSNSQFAFDTRHNVVIATGDEQTLGEVQALLQLLDQPTKPTPQPGSFDVRVVWLVAGLQDDDAPEPTGDLVPIALELEKLGISDLRVVSQIITNNALPEQPFRISGTAALDEQSCHLSVLGSIIKSVAPSRDRPSLEINITAGGPFIAGSGGLGGGLGGGGGGGGHSSSLLANIEATVLTPNGQFVVLGVSPIGKLTSVFAVQVTQGE